MVTEGIGPLATNDDRAPTTTA